MWALDNLDLRAIIDILIVAVLFFGASLLFRGTQAVALLRGTLLLIVGMIVLASLLQLQALGWVISNLLTVVAACALVVWPSNAGPYAPRYSGVVAESIASGVPVEVPSGCLPAALAARFG